MGARCPTSVEKLPVAQEVLGSLCPSVTQHAPYVAAFLSPLYKVIRHRIQFLNKAKCLGSGTGY